MSLKTTASFSMSGDSQMNVHSCLESCRTFARSCRSGSFVSRGRWEISPLSPYFMQLMWKWAMSPAREKNWSVSSCRRTPRV